MHFAFSFLRQSLKCSVLENVRNNWWLEADQIKKEMKLKIQDYIDLYHTMGDIVQVYI
jgi:hypothetical protein